MRALAGPALLLVVVGGFALHRLTSAPEAPSRQFLELEIASPDGSHEGACYSLDTLIVAHTAFTDTVTHWKPDGEEGWVLTFEGMGRDLSGPSHWFQHLTFREQEGQAKLVYVQASKDLPTQIGPTLDALLESPHARNSTPVDRCREPGATGYLFKRK